MIVGRYRLLRRIASGGMGEVYLGEARGAANFTRLVAIKRILPHLAHDEGFVRRFIDEANLVVQLHHGNIIPVQELAEHEGALYLVMEYLPGRDLKAVLKRLQRSGGRMPPDLAVWLIAEICAGLDYAHRRTGGDGRPLNIVHRDVSPSNICLGAGGEVKLADFGIARARGRLQESVSGALQGKFLYMSPEQADGRPVDARTDVFSAGVVLYELVSGRRPFEADSETETLRRVRECDVPPLSPDDVDPALIAILARALSPDPGARYPSAADLRRALIEYLSARRSHADASALARFLSGLYPDGVVPTGSDPEAPRSLDEALLAQLADASASKPDPHTRTLTGPDADNAPVVPSPAASASRPAQPVPLPDSDSRSGPHRLGQGDGPVNALPELALGSAPAGWPPPIGSGSWPSTPAGGASVTAPPAQPSRERRLWLVLGLLLGGALTAGVVTLASRDLAVARIEPQTDPPVVPGRVIRLGATRESAARLAPGAQVAAGAAVLCVSGDEHEEDCQYVQLEPGENAPLFRLRERSRLQVDLDPPVDGARVLINGLWVTEWPHELSTGSQTYSIEVLPPAGYEIDTPPPLIRRRPGLQQLRVRLLPISQPRDDRPVLAPDGEAEAHSAGVDGGAPRASRRPAAKTRTRRVQLDSEPIAQVLDGEEVLGTTPLSVEVPDEGRTLRLRADDFATMTVTLRGDERQRHIALQRWAWITIRALPGAAEIRLNGRPLGTGLVRERRVAPGTHRVSAHLQHEGRALSVERQVVLEPGERPAEAIVLTIEVAPGGPTAPPVATSPTSPLDAGTR